MHEHSELKIKNRILQIFLSTPDDRIYTEVLSMAREVLASAYGTFGYVDEDGSLVYPSMTSEIWDKCSMAGKTIRFPRESWGGLWGRSLREGETLYSNLAYRVPEGHIPIARSLSAPIIYQDALIGHIHVANKETDYSDHDVLLMDMIASGIAPFLHARLQRDFHERRRQHAEKALEESERLLADVFESIRDGISVLGTDLTILRVNNAMRLWYREKVPLEGQKCYACYHSVDKPCNPCPTLRCLMSGDTELEVVPGPAGSSVEWLEVSSYPMKDPSGLITGVVEIVRDITERKRMEAELLKVKKLEVTGILAGGIAHDFNNLLTAILGNIALAKARMQPDPEALILINNMQEASQRIRDLVKRFVTFSTGATPVKHSMPVREIIENSAGLALANTPVRPVVSIHENLWHCAVDPGQISQVIHIIMENAREAMPGGGSVEIRAENIDVTDADRTHGLPLQRGPYVRISITDQGTGISREDLPQVFDPYFSTKRRGAQKGMGLGLTAAYAIISKHEGHIYLESEPGTGTEVVILLPASSAATSGERTAQREKRSGTERRCGVDRRNGDDRRA